MQKSIHFFLLSLALCGIQRASAQSTIFNYQGRLVVDGNPANGLYEFIFTIYNIPTNGAIIAGPMTSPAVPVHNRLFTIPLHLCIQPFRALHGFTDSLVPANGT